MGVRGIWKGEGKVMVTSVDQGMQQNATGIFYWWRLVNETTKSKVPRKVNMRKMKEYVLFQSETSYEFSETKVFSVCLI